MYEPIRNTKKKEGGFTLVELLVVILIIGILAAVAIPAFLNQRQRANDAAVKSDVMNLAKVIESELISNPNVGSIAVATYEGWTDQVVLARINASPLVVSGRDYAEVTFDGVVVGERVTLSDGVAVRGAGDAQGYELEGAHANGKEYVLADDLESSDWLVYDSNNGGLQLGSNSGDDSGDSNGDDNGAGNLTAQEQALLAEGAAWIEAVRSQYEGDLNSVQLSFGSPVVDGNGTEPASYSLPSLSSSIMALTWYPDHGITITYRDSEYNRWYITSAGEKWGS